MFRKRRTNCVSDEMETYILSESNIFNSLRTFMILMQEQLCRDTLDEFSVFWDNFSALYMNKTN